MPQTVYIEQGMQKGHLQQLMDRSRGINKTGSIIVNRTGAATRGSSSQSPTEEPRHHVVSQLLPLVITWL